ncbi:MAG: DHH family phosphoesterase [Lachnospiraceae bacterium]|nr:DHH family phosphoesterase [Lachnospiraceae bacterium]
MDNRFMHNNRIKKFLQVPFLLLAVLAAMNVVIYAMDKRAGGAATLFVCLYLLLLVLMYFHYKPAIMAEMVAFAFEQGKVQKELLKELGLPYILVDTSGRPLWANRGFYEIVGGEKTAKKKTLFQLFPDLTKESLPISREEAQMRIMYEEKSFRVEMKRICLQDALTDNTISASDVAEAAKKQYGKKYRRLVKDGGQNELEAVIDEHDIIVAVYFYDETELQAYIRENQEQKLVVGQIYIDNYEEAMDSVEEVRQALLIALIDRKINVYMQNIDAIVKKMEKDKYFFVFKQKYLSQLETTKFALLDEVRAINIGNELAVTLSISIGAEADSFLQAYDSARVAMDLALGRGGDQAVVKYGERIVYYGGKSQGVEKTTRVKARVKAHALREILETKDKVIIMGHRLPDVDCLGSALGIYRLADALGKKAHIVINEATISVRPIMNNFAGNSIYPEDLFYNSEQAVAAMDADTLLVVVDVNRPTYTECPELLSMTNSIVVLDHHRQTSETIQNATLSYVEPYASSACEMVAEVLQYIVDKPKLRSLEADAMYAGILVDTDNFVTKTGVRTFEAAAFLRRSGADVVRVRKMFRSDMEDFKQKARGVEHAEVFLDIFAISTMPVEGVDSPTVMASKVANELLNIAGVHASFVFTDLEGVIYISARSIDDINVQVIMEKLGGGGHANAAGAQLTDVSLQEGIMQVKKLLEQMREEGDL